MAKRLWKCKNCEGDHDFESEIAICPQCKLDGSTSAGKRLLLPRIVIHFDPPSGIYGVGKGVLACTGKPLIAGGFRGSGEPSAVTCPHCKKTKEFIESLAASQADPAFDLPDEVPATLERG